MRRTGLVVCLDHIQALQLKHPEANKADESSVNMIYEPSQMTVISEQISNSICFSTDSTSRSAHTTLREHADFLPHLPMPVTSWQSYDSSHTARFVRTRSGQVNTERELQQREPHPAYHSAIPEPSRPHYWHIGPLDLIGIRGKDHAACSDLQGRS